MKKHPIRFRFVDSHYGTVTDTNSGLTWIKDPSTLGGVWGSPGNPSRMTWQEAKENCRKLNFAGIKDWRLPEDSELLLLIYPWERSEKYQAIDTKFIPNIKPDHYWSNQGLGLTSARRIRLLDVDIRRGKRDQPLYVWPVTGPIMNMEKYHRKKLLQKKGNAVATGRRSSLTGQRRAKKSID